MASRVTFVYAGAVDNDGCIVGVVVVIGGVTVAYVVVVADGVVVVVVGVGVVTDVDVVVR